MTSPTTQVNSSCRMMVKSSSSVRQSFMASDKFYRMSPIQVVQHGPALSAGQPSFKKRFAFARILAGILFVQLDTKARFLRKRDESILNNRLRHSFDQIIPEGNIRSMEFEHEKIRDGSAEMRGSQSSDWTTDVVRRNRNGLSVRKMRNVARHRQASDLLQVWGNDSHSMRLQNLSESFKQIEVFASSDRDSDLRTHRSQGSDAFGRDRILEPQKPERFQSACNLDHVTDAVAPVAIDGDVRVSANGFVNGANQSNHAINRSICKATVVRIRTFRARHVEIKLQGCVPLRPHRNRLLTVIVRRGWCGPLGLTEIILRSLLATVPHPRRLTRTKNFVQVFERFASMAIGIDSYLIPELSAEQSINRYL